MTDRQHHIRHHIIGAVSEVFGLDPQVVAQGVSPDRIAGWDSEKHVRLVVALEERLGVLFEPEEVPELVSLERMEAILTRHV